MARSARDLDLRQHHGVETPEHVDVRFELAGVGSRMAAGLVDAVFITVANLLIFFGWGALGGLSGSSEFRGWLTALIILLLFAITWGYYTLFEALNGGRTPGKQFLGIRVVMDTGHAVTPGAAVVRNLVRFVDSVFPMPVVPAVLSIFLNSSNKRPGDMAAGTIVVRDRPTDWAIGAKAAAAEPQVLEPIETGPPDLSEDEFRLLDRFLARLNELTPEVQARITADLVRRFESRIPRRCGIRDSNRRTRSAVMRAWTSGVSSLSRARNRSSRRNSSSDNSGGPVSIGSRTWGSAAAALAPIAQSVGRSRTTIV